jgi:hypothetical protein
MKESIPIETRIAIALTLLGNGNSWQTRREVYGIAEIQHQL